MARIVMKFGGTSVADLDRIEAVADRVAAEWARGDEIAVVVSAMAGVTNQLVDWCRTIAPMHDAREYDSVVATGEQVTAGLLAMALQGRGAPARSWLGWQLPFETDAAHGKARIQRIEVADLERRFAEERQIPVLAGFQGRGADNRITTLGRGGSDTSAVALAAALKADRCDIYTDVDGVYTCDPRIVTKARRLDKVTYEEMLEMASLGTKVLQTRSVEMAMKHAVRLRVLSTFTAPVGDPNVGTYVVGEEEIMEQAVVSGVAYSRDEAKITVVGVPDQPGVAAAIFGPLTDEAINVDMIVQNISLDDGTTDMTFTVGLGEFDRALAALERSHDTLGYDRIVSDKNVVKISVIGMGMRSHAGVAQTMFKALAERGV
ncbi:MAG: aspartate kinase, partial [Pseudomonadota bacterium]